MAEATGRTPAEPGLSGELQGIANPNPVNIKAASLVLVEEVGTIDAEAEHSRQVNVGTGTIASSMPGEELATRVVKDSTAKPGSGSNTGQGAPPTPPSTAPRVESILDQQSIMATTGSPEATADQNPIPDPGDEVEVDADVCPSVDKSQLNTANIWMHEVPER
jgi:hypothetical protein